MGNNNNKEEKKEYSVLEYADKEKITPSAVYKRIHEGRVEHKRIGSTYIVVV